jgi:molybdate transport system substrate-binding protein
MELSILSAGAAKGLVQALQAQFQCSSGATISGSFGAVWSIKEQFDTGAPCGVVILTAKILAGLEAKGDLIAGSVVPLGRVGTGVAVSTGTASPAIAERDALSASLKKAKAIYLPDPVRSTAGIHFVEVLKKLGIYDEVQANLQPYPNGAIAMAHMAQNTEDDVIGCTQVTEILYTKGVTLVGLLPKEFELSTMYSAGISRNAANPELARQFIELLTGSQTQKLRVDGGFSV